MKQQSLSQKTRVEEPFRPLIGLFWFVPFTSLWLCLEVQQRSLDGRLLWMVNHKMSKNIAVQRQRVVFGSIY